MDDGTIIEIPKMACPRCWLNVAPSLDPVHVVLKVVAKLQRKGDKLEVRICPECGHKQQAVVDEWT